MELEQKIAYREWLIYWRRWVRSVEVLHQRRMMAGSHWFLYDKRL